MKPVLRLDLCDLSNDIDKADNFLLRALATRFELQLRDHPDILVYSDHGQRHRLHSKRRVFYTAEAIPGDFRRCDYALLPHHTDNPRAFRIPHYATVGDPAALIKEPGEAGRVFEEKREFCAFVVSQDHKKKTRNRIAFFHRLSRYKKVSSGGRMLNNIGGPLGPTRQDKLAFLRRHKFTIAFENARFPGYTTEKIYDAMEARSIPIYWGDPQVAQEFNPKSFINVAEFPSLDHAIQRIVEIDNDPELYRSILAEPYFPDNRPTPVFDPAPLCDFFQRILEDRSTPVAATGLRKFFGNWNRWVLVKRTRI